MAKITISIPTELKAEIYKVKRRYMWKYYREKKFNVSEICRRALEKEIKQIGYEITTA